MSPYTPRSTVRFGPSAIWALAAAGLSALSGCAHTPTGTIDTSCRAEVRTNDYSVFYLPVTELDANASEQDRRNHTGLETLDQAVERELKDRGFQVTRNARAKDIDAYITFGYRVAGTSGTQTTVNPGYRYQLNGQWITNPGTVIRTPYANDNQTIDIEIYDWNELAAVGFETGRLKPAWRGSLNYTAGDMNGLTSGEAEFMTMNLLADFPTPRGPSGPRKAQLFGSEERHLLWNRPASDKDKGASVAQR